MKNNILSKLKLIKNKFIDILYPRHIKCIFCGDEINNLSKFDCCEKCYKNLNIINNSCLKCGNPFEHADDRACLICKANNYYFDYAQSVFQYKDGVAKIIQNLKYNNAKYLDEPLGEFLYNKFIELNWQIDIITFVPLHEKRKKQRGYNQAEILAKQLSNKSGIEMKSLIKRVKDTPSQTNLKIKERAKNMEEAFKLADKNVEGLNILIIDDVLTTGATVNEISKVLKNAKVKNIYILTLAHAMFTDNY